MFINLQDHTDTKNTKAPCFTKTLKNTQQPKKYQIPFQANFPQNKNSQ